MVSDAARIQRLMPVVGDAQKLARTLLDRLANEAHPQTDEAASLFQELTAMEVALFDLNKRPDLTLISESLSKMSARCSGALAELKPLILNARRIASE